ncbi:MAG: helix-turn-helix transcriptional regulator [Mediterraneibacter gnavus]
MGGIYRGFWKTNQTNAIERKLTQEQLANQLGVSRQAVSNWENNKNLPDYGIDHRNFKAIFRFTWMI